MTIRTVRSTFRLVILSAFVLFTLTQLAFDYTIGHAARPDAPRFAKRGPFSVGTREFTIKDPAGDRDLPATIWYPAQNPDHREEKNTYRDGLLVGEGQALSNADPDNSKGPYPLVVFSHGLGGMRYQSLFFTEHLASYGFVVIAADHPGSTFANLLQMSPDAIIANFALRPLDVLREIAFAENLSTHDQNLDSMIDMSRIAVTGHSYGGYTTMAVGGARLDFAALKQKCGDNPLSAVSKDITCTLGLYADRLAQLRGLKATPIGLWPATTDTRIKALIAMAPSNAPNFGRQGLASVTVPTMIIFGTKDQVVKPEDNDYPYYEQIGSQQKALVALENANHFIFVERCVPYLENTPLYSQCSDAVWDMDRAHDLINHMATAFLLSVLYGQTEANTALQPGAVNFNFVGVTYQSTLK